MSEPMKFLIFSAIIVFLAVMALWNPGRQGSKK
jgi:hypothetical protein